MQRLENARLRIGPSWGRPVFASAILAVALLGWQAFGSWNAATHIDPALDALLREQGRANVEVTLAFPPEKFHLLYFQNRGRMLGIENERVLLGDVSADQVRRIAREYWVTRVRILER